MSDQIADEVFPNKSQESGSRFSMSWAQRHVSWEVKMEQPHGLCEKCPPTQDKLIGKHSSDG